MVFIFEARPVKEGDFVSACSEGAYFRGMGLIPVRNLFRNIMTTNFFQIAWYLD